MDNNQSGKVRLTTLIGCFILGVVFISALLGYSNILNRENSYPEEKITVNNDPLENIILEENTVEEKTINPIEEVNDTDEDEDATKKEAIVKDLFDQYDESKDNFLRVDREEYSGQDEEYYYIDDIDGDSNLECLALYSGHLTIYRYKDGNIETILENEYINTYVNPVLYKVENRETKEIEYYFDAFDADGLCFVSSAMVKLDLSEENPSLKYIYGYTCDDEEEERKRQEMGQDESVDDLANAHTLKYMIGTEKVSKDEYDKNEKSFGKSYNLLFTTTDEKTIFDEAKSRKLVNRPRILY